MGKRCDAVVSSNEWERHPHKGTLLSELNPMNLLKNVDTASHEKEYKLAVTENSTKLSATRRIRHSKYSNNHLSSWVFSVHDETSFYNSVADEGDEGGKKKRCR